MRLLWPFVVVTLVAIGTQAKTLKCSISGDPHVTTFGNQRTSFPWPCVFPATRLQKSVEELGTGHTVNIEVSTASDMETYKDQYFVSYVKVTLAHIINDTEVANSSFTLDASIKHLIETNAKRANWAVENRVPHEMREDIVERITDFGYDRAKNLYYLSVNDSLTVTFRPVNRNQGIPQASGRPGLAIEVTEGQYNFSNATFPNTLCSTPSDRRPFHKLMEEGGYLTKEGLMVSAAIHADLGLQSDQRCTNTLGRIQTRCNPPYITSHQIEYVINSFGELLGGVVPMEIKMCLEKKTNLFDLFALHIKDYMCGDNEAQKKRVKIMSECLPKPQPMNAVQLWI